MFGDRLAHRFRRDFAHFAAGAQVVLQRAALQAALADDQPLRNSDEIHVGEHHAGALVAVVQ